MSIPETFICVECQHRFIEERDEDGFFNGNSAPRCPECGGLGTSPNDYGDFYCEYCKYFFRKYGNGGLTLGCIPCCPKCGDSYMVRELRLYI